MNDDLELSGLQKSFAFYQRHGVTTHVMLEAIDDSLVEEFALAGIHGMDAAIREMHILFAAQDELLKELHE